MWGRLPGDFHLGVKLTTHLESSTLIINPKPTYRIPLILNSSHSQPQTSNPQPQTSNPQPQTKNYKTTTQRSFGGGVDFRATSILASNSARFNSLPRLVLTCIHVSGFEFRVSGFGFRVLGFRPGVSVWCLVFGVLCFVFGVSGFGFRVSSFVFRVPELEFRVLGFWFRAWGFGLGIGV